MATTCGVDNSFTFASDPNNSTTINAVAVFGAIRVSWNYPTVNAHAVAHLRLLRGTSAAGGTELAIVKGNSYVDNMSQSQAGITYYYWIQIVSVNGTLLATIGPASATASALVGDIISLLSDQINNSHLAAYLRSEIEDIPTLRTDLINETTGRLQALSDIDDVLDTLGLDVTTAFADIITQRDLRLDGDNALASQITAIAASNGQNLAAIITEQTARVTGDSAEASARTLMGVRIDDAEAAITLEQTTRADADGALASQISSLSSQSINTFRQATAPTEGEGRRVDSLWFDTDDNNRLWQWDGAAWVDLQDQGIIDAFAAIVTEQTARTSQYDAIAIDVTDVEASIAVIEGDIDAVPSLISANVQSSLAAQVGYCMIGGFPSSSTAYDTKSECESAGGTWLELREIATAVSGVQINDGSSGLKIQEHMSAYRTELGTLQGEYSVKFQGTGTNAVIGGFGLTTGGPAAAPTVDCHFDVSKFSIGTLGSKKFPFIVDGGDVYIASAFIEDLSVDTIKISNGAITKPLLITSTATKFWYSSTNAWSSNPVFAFEMPRDFAATYASIPLKIETCFAYRITDSGSATQSILMDVAFEWRARHLPSPQLPFDAVTNTWGAWSAWGSGVDIIMGNIDLNFEQAYGNFSAFVQLFLQSQSQYEYRLAPLGLNSAYWLQALFFRMHVQFTAFIR